MCGGHPSLDTQLLGQFSQLAVGIDKKNGVSIDGAQQRWITKHFLTIQQFIDMDALVDNGVCVFFPNKIYPDLRHGCLQVAQQWQG